MMPKDRAVKRANWIRSECEELEAATTLVDQADAFIDIIYFAIGGLVELGLRWPQRLWNIVQGANMAKLWPDGKPRYHPDSKVMKPPGWKAPEPQLEAEVAHQIKAYGRAA
jgi:predicted HAD superfamily Cof-like phosphohydrolase